MTSSHGSAREGHQRQFAALDETSAPREMQVDNESPLWETCCAYVAFQTVKAMKRRGISSEWRDEIVQDVLIAICEGLARFQDNARLTTWITQIVYFKTIDKVRERVKDRKHGVVSLDDLDEMELEELADTKPPPEETYIRGEEHTEEQRLLEAFCQAQRDPQKTATLLNLALQEASTSTMAEQADISPDTVRRYIRQAQHYLQAATRDYAQTTNVSFEQTSSINRKRTRR